MSMGAGALRHGSVLLGIAGLFAGLAPSARADPVPVPPLRVGVAGSAPFVVDGGGLAVDVWRRVATDLGVEYELVPVESIPTAISEVRRGALDLAVGPISITAARTASVAFTQPYFRSRMGIMAPAEGPRLWDRIKPFLSLAFAVGVGFLVLVLFIVGNLIWVLERRANPTQFPEPYVKGVGSGMWLALVTMTTVGYGDKAPVSVMGRVVVGVWMVISMITASSLTASIATALTLAQLDRSDIEGIESLRGRRVAVVQGTTGADVAERVEARVVGTSRIEDAITLVATGEAEAVVADFPILRYQVLKNPKLPVTVIESNQGVQTYGFALRYGSGIEKALNVALLRLRESGEMAVIDRRWLAR